MAEVRLAIEAEADLDSIWLHMARETGSVEIANRVVDRITDRFWVLAFYPYIGRKREDLQAGLRSLLADDYVIFHRIENEDVVLILHVVHGSRDIAAFLQ